MHLTTPAHAPYPSRYSAWLLRRLTALSARLSLAWRWRRYGRSTHRLTHDLVEFCSIHPQISRLLSCFLDLHARKSTSDMKLLQGDGESHVAFPLKLGLNSGYGESNPNSETTEHPSSTQTTRAAFALCEYSDARSYSRGCYYPILALANFTTGKPRSEHYAAPEDRGRGSQFGYITDKYCQVALWSTSPEHLSYNSNCSYSCELNIMAESHLQLVPPPMFQVESAPPQQFPEIEGTGRSNPFAVTSEATLLNAVTAQLPYLPSPLKLRHGSLLVTVETWSDGSTVARIPTLALSASGENDTMALNELAQEISDFAIGVKILLREAGKLCGPLLVQWTGLNELVDTSALS